MRDNDFFMIGTDVTKAQALLERGQVIALPTETVYGLAADALKMSAIARLFEIKKRPNNKPLVLQTHSLEQVSKLVKHIPPKANKLAKAFWPGGLTLILEKKIHLPDLVTAGSHTVGIRIPDHPITLRLLQALSFPLAVSSANLSGKPSATTVEGVYRQLKGTVPYILDGGRCKLGIASTVIGFSQNEAILYRKGCISEKAIERIVGRLCHLPYSTP